MKKHFTKFIVILLVVLMTLMVTSGAIADTKKGFDGAWEAIDFDGSYMVMTINSDNTAYMMYDFGASVCYPDPKPSTPEISWSFEGPPIIDGDELMVNGLGLCVDGDFGPHYTGEHTLNFTYDKNSDTINLIYDNMEPPFIVTFSRIEKK